MAGNVYTRNLRDGTLTIKDGSTNTLEVTLEEGDLSFTEGRPATVVLDRGVLDHFRDTAEVPVALSFTIKFHEYKAESVSGDPPSVRDALLLEGNASGWTNTNTGDVKTTDLDFVLANPYSSGKDETLTFSDFKCEECVFTEGDEYDTIACSGRALVTNPTSAWA